MAFQGFQIEFNYIILLTVIIQLNDYSGTLEPYVSFVLKDSDTVAFLGFSALARNSILLFLLANLMPDVKLRNGSVGGLIAYSLYQLVIPTIVSLVIFVPTTMMIKQGKY